MSMVKGKSGLLIPEYIGKMTGQYTLSIDALSQWRDNLSLSDLSKTAKDLFVILQDSHQANISKKERYKILDFLKPTLNYLTIAIQKFYETQEIPSGAQWLAIDLIDNLYLEMLNGYKLIIEDIEKSFFPHKKLLILALQNAFYYSSLILLYSYREHINPPAGTWLEIHHLYSFCKRKKLNEKSLPKFLEWEFQYAQFNDMYKHYLLFAITQPFRLRKEEISYLYDATQIWAPLLILEENKEHTTLFAIDVSKDTAPINTFYSQIPKEKINLNLENVIKRLHELINIKNVASSLQSKYQKNYSNKELMLPTQLMDDLLALWNPKVLAKKRQKIQGNVSICLGISSSFWHLEKDMALMTLPKKVKLNQHFTITETIDIDVLPEQHSKIKHPFFVCELIDQSENGYCLKWLNEVSPSLQCGEIIGIPKEIEKNQLWSIGNIRWIKTEENNTILFGVEIMSPLALPVKVRLYGTDRALFEALLLKGNLELHKSMTLITPPLFKPNQEIEIHFEQKQYIAVLLENHSRSRNYAEFSLSPLSPDFEFPEI